MRRVALTLLVMLASSCETSTGPNEPDPPAPAPKAASIRLLTAPPSSSGSRITFTTQPVLQLRDSIGAPVAIAGVQITAAAAPGLIHGTATATTNAQGTATFTDLSVGGKAGAQTLTFSSPGLPDVSHLIMLSAGMPAKASASGQDQTWLAGAQLPGRIKLTITDEDENEVRDVPVTAEVASGGGSVTGATGKTSFFGDFELGSWTLGAVPGPNTLTVSVAGSATTWTINATGVAPTAACGQAASLLVGPTQYGWLRASQCTIIDPYDYLFGYPAPKRFNGPEAGGTYFYDRFLLDVPAGAIVRIDAKNDSFSPWLMAFDMSGVLVDEEFLSPLTLNNASAATRRYQLLVIPFRTGETGPYPIVTRRLN